MGLNKKENTSRRKFIKGVAGAAAFGCACFSLNSLAASSGDKIKAGKGKEHLAAACGTYCGACPAYLAKHGSEEQIKLRLEKRLSSQQPKPLKRIPDPRWMDGLLCDGCMSGGMLAAHCQNCAIRNCAANKQPDSRCAGCEELPCQRITGLINMGSYLHRKEYLPNLAKIREMGVQEWIQYEAARWRCPRCGLPMSWYDAECVGCGEPRSKELFAVT
ncbi:MAG: DUF3795 domain-containing protein [Prolixibacteraceae bacterium]|nr:DUF3795 domain-containing protein [Prolixibacteraceae bacterium]